jgi:hypothetical protein
MAVECARPWGKTSFTGHARMELARQMVEIPVDGGSHSTVVRVGQTVRRASHSWSSAVLDLLGHLECEGFAAAPRALGFDDQGREVLTSIEGEVGLGDRFIPDQGAGSISVSRIMSGVTTCSCISARSSVRITMPRRRFRGLAMNGCSSLGSLLRRSVTTNSSRGTPSFGRACRRHSSIGTPRRRGLALGTSDSLCGVGCRFRLGA